MIGLVVLRIVNRLRRASPRVAASISQAPPGEMMSRLLLANRMDMRVTALREDTTFVQQSLRGRERLLVEEGNKAENVGWK